MTRSSPVLCAHIGGHVWEAASTEAVSLSSPWDGSHRADIRFGGVEAVEAAVLAALDAYKVARGRTAFERAAWLTAAADEIERRADEIVEASIGDIGKPRRAATFEVRRTVAFMRATAAQVLTLGVESMPLDVNAGGEGRLGMTRRIPFGVVAAITPFNAPANLLMQKVAPAIAMGNAVIVKPSIEGTRVALVVAECFKAVGGPAGLLNIVPGGPTEAVALASHPAVAVVTVTGGPVAGEALARATGAKKFIAELGGNAANIVLDDADIQDAAKRIAQSGFEASGQQCISAQRVIVSSAVYEPLLEALVAASATMSCGDPSLPSTDLGPVVNRRSAERIMASILSSQAAGARLVLGGECEGCLIPPTILAEAPRGSAIVREEIFGPAVAVLAVSDDDEAIAIANDNDAGLQGAVFTRDIDRAFRVADRLEVGSVWINEGSRFRLDSYPFGGVGKSGHGREGVRFALEEYSQLKFTGVRLR